MRVRLQVGDEIVDKRSPAYTVSTLLSALGLDLDEGQQGSDSISIHYGKKEASTAGSGALINIAASENETPYPFDILFIKALKRVTCLHKGNLSPLPGILYRYDKSEIPAISFDSKKVNIEPDLISSAFALLTRLEEVGSKSTDKYGRFPHADSLVYKLGLLRTPLVNVYARVIRDAIWHLLSSMGKPMIIKAPWPCGKKFAVCLTHDVDRLRLSSYKGLRSDVLEVKQALFDRRAGKSLAIVYRLMSLWLRRHHPLWFSKQIISEEARNGFTSTFFVLVRKDHPMDADYSIRGRHTMALLREIIDHGSEVGLHGSFESPRNAALLRSEKVELEHVIRRPVVGGRQHYLRCNWPATFRIHAEIGLQYDSTLGFGQQPGYRASFGFPFQLYDPVRREPLNLLEIPLNVMDFTLYNYLGLSASQAWPFVEDQLETTRREGQLLVMLWHNIPVDLLDNGSYMQLYGLITNWIARNNGWGCSAERLTDWWETRKNTSITQEEKKDGLRLIVSDCEFPISYLQLKLPEGQFLGSAVGDGFDVKVTPEGLNEFALEIETVNGKSSSVDLLLNDNAKGR